MKVHIDYGEIQLCHLLTFVIPVKSVWLGFFCGAQIQHCSKKFNTFF